MNTSRSKVTPRASLYVKCNDKRAIVNFNFLSERKDNKQSAINNFHLCDVSGLKSVVSKSYGALLLYFYKFSSLIYCYYPHQDESIIT